MFSQQPQGMNADTLRCSPLIVVVKPSIVPLRVGGAQGTSGKEQTLLLGWVIISPSDSHKDSHKGKGR